MKTWMRNGASSQKQTITTSQSKNLFASIAEDGPDAFLDLGDLGKALPEATDTLQIPGVRQEPLGEILNSQWSTVSRGKKPKTTIASKGPAAIGRKVVDPGNNANLEAEDRYTFTPGVRFLSGVSFSKIQAGVIVWHLDIRKCLDKGMIRNGKNVFQVEDKTWYMRKGRFWLITAVGNLSFTEVPIYTFENRGLRAKPLEIRREYMTMRPKHIEAARFKNDSKYYDPLEIDTMAKDAEKFRETACVHVNEEHSRTIDDCPNIRIVADITSEAWDRYAMVSAALKKSSAGRK